MRTILQMKGKRKATTPAQWRKEFIGRVRAARVVSGKSASELAEFLGVSLDTYGRWEKRSLLPHQFIMPFCRATKADPVFLLTGSPFDLGELLGHAGTRA
jgi:transcriptional regulator with XRE-family HTH domain